jgi:hypothetical protein
MVISTPEPVDRGGFAVSPGVITTAAKEIKGRRRERNI